MKKYIIEHGSFVETVSADYISETTEQQRFEAIFTPDSPFSPMPECDETVYDGMNENEARAELKKYSTLTTQNRTNSGSIEVYYSFYELVEIVLDEDGEEESYKTIAYSEI